MKKFNMQTLVNYFAFQNNIPSDIADAVDELKAELKQEAEKTARKIKAKKTYSWDKPVKMTVDFDAMYYNATRCLYSNEPYTFREAIKQELARQDDDVYYNITEEIREQVANDFRKYLLEHQLFLEGMFDDEE